MELGGVVSGTGNIIVDNDITGVYFDATNTISGTLTIESGYAANGVTNAQAFDSFSHITVTDGGSLHYDAFDGTGGGTFAVPLTVGGTGIGAVSDINHSYPLDFGTVGSGGTFSLNLTGAITLTSNVKVAASDNLTVHIKGALAGTGFSLQAAASNVSIVNESTSNTSATPSGALTAEKVTDPTVAAGDNQPNTEVIVLDSHTLTIDGVRGQTIVQSGGKLLGTGTVGLLGVGGTVAPGHSPGCLASGNFSLSGTYEAELGGTTVCSEYDQMKVTGTVTLESTSATLNASLYNDFKPKKDDTFMIIDNDGTADAVTGTFKGLDEGATFDVGGNTLKITYKGGDGNDVVLTVLTVGTPNSGFSLVAGNPVVSLMLTTLAAVAIYSIGNKRRMIDQLTFKKK
jgi:hypothetical protein